MKKTTLFVTAILLAAVPALAHDTYKTDRKHQIKTNELKLYDRDGGYHGKLSANKFDPESTSNPYGRYGSKFSPDSINNPYGRFGSKFSIDSPNNPLGQGLIIKSD